MTFSPRKKISRSKGRTRTTNWIQLTARKLMNRTSLQYNENGEATGLSHFADENGVYKGRTVVAQKRSKVKKIRA